MTKISFDARMKEPVKNLATKLEDKNTKKVQTFDSSYFIVKSIFIIIEDDMTQKYSAFQPVFNCLKMPANNDRLIA